MLVYWALLSIVLVWLTRVVLDALLREAHRRGRDLERVLIVGDGEQAQVVEAKIRSDNDWHAYNFALGSTESTQTIHVSPSSVFSSLLKSNDYCAAKFGERSVCSREELITIRRLDAVLDEMKTEP